jgi:hypothetical protein
LIWSFSSPPPPLPLLPFRVLGVLPHPRLPLLLRITIYSRQVISLALEACYLGQLDFQYLYPFRSPGGPAIPPGTGCSFQSPFTTHMSYVGAIPYSQPPHGSWSFSWWLKSLKFPWAISYLYETCSPREHNWIAISVEKDYVSLELMVINYSSKSVCERKIHC